MFEKFGIDNDTVSLCEGAEKELKQTFLEIDGTADYNQLKVISAMQNQKLSEAHFAGTNGYGYNDIGRDAVEKIYADIFGCEDALVRGQMISGTHALTAALFGNLRPGDTMLSPNGKPYDTLDAVIGITPKSGSLADFGIGYDEVPLKNDAFDFAAIKAAITDKTRLVSIQRSKGYTTRRAFTVAEIGELTRFIKGIRANITVMVDNCYGEFVEKIEPTEVGADMVVGSLIKNIGGGIASVGGYVAGNSECVENAANRLISPALGKEAGPSLGLNRDFLQGLFFAPQIVGGALKGAVLASLVFEKLGYSVTPSPQETRGDIVTAIELGSKDAVIAFCRGIQAASPVDSFVTPEAAYMPGYDHDVVMAAGAFTSGSSIELSADAPIKPPYNVFLQGGLSYVHAKLGLMKGLQNLKDGGLLRKY